jgi:hypothetical protein
VARGDLDLDGRSDYLLVLERGASATTDAELEGNPRMLRVLIATAAGGYTLAAESERAVLCSRCGGALGDPFEGVEAGEGRFTVHHYGGSSWRWRADFTFAYSRRDKAWQLVEVVDLSHHTSDTAAFRREVSRPPRDFGKIDLRQFDPARWKGRGAR